MAACHRVAGGFTGGQRFFYADRLITDIARKLGVDGRSPAAASDAHCTPVIILIWSPPTMMVGWLQLSDAACSSHSTLPISTSRIGRYAPVRSVRVNSPAVSNSSVGSSSAGGSRNGAGSAIASGADCKVMVILFPEVFAGQIPMVLL